MALSTDHSTPMCLGGRGYPVIQYGSDNHDRQDRTWNDRLAPLIDLSTNTTTQAVTMGDAHGNILTNVITAGAVYDSLPSSSSSSSLSVSSCKAS